MTAAELFDELAADYVRREDVTYGRTWHNDGLKVGGKIFAMTVRDQLVVKLPAAQASELFGTGEGVPFEPRPGRSMREWVVIDGAERERWRELIADAYRYGLALAAKGR